MDARPCPFLDPAHDEVLTRGAVGLSRAPRPVGLPTPVIVADVRAPPHWVGDQRRLWHAVAASMHGGVALLGEHVDNPRGGDDAGLVDPVVAIETLASEGVAVIATVTGRDRDLPSARATMCRYAAAGAVAIHCVTGDHPRALSIARDAEFGAEAVSLVEVANDLGLATTVGESPASPGARVERLALKRAAGAGACILNHSGEVEDLVAFAEACRQGGVELPLIAPIPMVADMEAAASLVRFPGLRLPNRFVDPNRFPHPNRALGMVANESGPVEASIVLVSLMSAALAKSGCFIGVNLSGSATGGDPYARIELSARFVAAAREAWNGVHQHGPPAGAAPR